MYIYDHMHNKGVYVFAHIGMGFALLFYMVGQCEGLKKRNSNSAVPLFCCVKKRNIVADNRLLTTNNIMELSLLWNSFKGFAQRVGRRTARTPLLLYYVLKSDTTSKRDKAMIYAALAYLILPVDVIRSRRFGLLGWVDEYLAINVVFDRMQKYITPTMYTQAKRQLDEWMG